MRMLVNGILECPQRHLLQLDLHDMVLMYQYNVLILSANLRNKVNGEIV